MNRSTLVVQTARTTACFPLPWKTEVLDVALPEGIAGDLSDRIDRLYAFDLDDYRRGRRRPGPRLRFCWTGRRPVSEGSSREDSGSSSTGGPLLDVCQTLPETVEVSVLGTVEGWLYDRNFAMTGSGTCITHDGRSRVEVDAMGQSTPWLALPEQLHDFTFLRPAGDFPNVPPWAGSTH